MLQVPLELEQTPKAEVAPAPDEVLVLRGLVDPDGRPVVACFEGARNEPRAAAPLPAAR